MSIKYRLVDYVGVGGVDLCENQRALKVESWFRWPMLFMAAWIPVQIYLEAHHYLSQSLAENLSTIIWLAFILEAVVLGYLVKNRKHYYKTNWMNLFIILTALPALWGDTALTEVLRLLRMVIIPKLIISWWLHR